MTVNYSNFKLCFIKCQELHFSEEKCNETKQYHIYNETKLMHIFKQSLILWEIVQVQGNFFSLKFGGIESNCKHQIILPLCLLEILEFFSSLLWWGRGDYRWNSDFMSALQTKNNWICTLPNLLPNMYKSSRLGHHFRDKLFIWSTS